MKAIQQTVESRMSNVMEASLEKSLCGRHDVLTIDVDDRTINIMQPLCLALEKHNYQIAHILIQNGADVKLASKDSLPMAYALEDKDCNVLMVKAIIEAGFPVNDVVHLPTHRRSLHCAVLTNNLSVVEYLFSVKASPHVKDYRGLTPLHYAVQKNCHEMVRLLAKNGAVLDCRCNEHIPPMFYCIAMGYCDMVDLLLSLGADIHYVVTASTNCQLTPLHFAASVCKLEIVELLIAKGADVNNATPKTKETPLHSAARGETENIRINEIALDCIIEVLIKNKADLHQRQHQGLTPLQIALQSKNISIALILIVNGSALNNKLEEDDEKGYTTGYTTFHIAAKCLDKELIQVCFDYGANWNNCDKDKDGPYPIHFALLAAMLDADFNKKTEKHVIFHMFWKKGFPFEMTFKTNWLDKDSPALPSVITSMVRLQKLLIKGIQFQQQSVVERALTQGAVAQCRSRELPYPIHFICSKGNHTMLKCLLTEGVNSNTLNKQGETALHAAAKGGHIECCKLLLEYGACYCYRSVKCPKSPVQLARANKHINVVKLLCTIDKYFQSIIKEGVLLMIKPEMKLFNVLMNCRNRAGLTLLATAAELENESLVEQLMELRLQCKEL